MKTLGISTSPRANGNSDMLLRKALDGAALTGAQTEYISLRDLKIAVCIECNACYKTGKCKTEDDYQLVLEKMLQADRLIFATPIFFMAVCAQAKTLIDRCQCLWANKYVLKEPLFPDDRDRRAMVIAIGGSKGTKMFESVKLTMKYFLDALEAAYVSNLFINNINRAGEIEKHPSALRRAFELGKDLTATTPPPEKPTDIELTT